MTARRQLARYIIVGLLSNALLYVLYIVLTKIGMPAQAAMTVAFTIGVAQNYTFNRRWTFQFQEKGARVALRYAIAYAAAYAINYQALEWLAEPGRYPHELVQGVMVIVCAALLFLAQRYWVFRSVASEPNTRGSC